MRYALLFIPYFLTFLTGDPDTAFTIAWLGSFWIFWLTISGRVHSLPKDLPFAEQFMRPVILTQLVFGSYMAVTSIFFFMDLHGYVLFSKPLYRVINFERIQLAAHCEQLYSLAHACLVTGMLLFESRRARSTKRFTIIRFSSVFMLSMAGLFSVIALATKFIPGFSQLVSRFNNLTLITSIIALVLSLRERRPAMIFVGLTLFMLNLFSAFLSGWKEAVLVPIIILAVMVFPLYKKSVFLVAVPIFLALLFFLPAYNDIVRKQSWFKGVAAQEAAENALDQIQQGKVNVKESNWEFLTLRLSEIYMFTRFIEFVPVRHDYYGLEIVTQAAESIIPRVFIPGKEDIEKMVMERVYQAGVVKRGSVISAKPAPIVDAYLSAAELGIVITFLLIGITASFASREAERLFGGYLPGTAWIYTGLFQIFWRGNCFEFMVNNIFWSFVVMYFIFWVGRQLNYIRPVKQ